VRKIIRDQTAKRPLAMLGAWLMKPVFRALKNHAHWESVGGCPLVGVDGLCVIGHGRSNAKAVANALKRAAHGVETKVMENMRDRFRSRGSSSVLEATGSASA